MIILSAIFALTTPILCLYCYKSGKESGFKLGKHMGFKDGYCEGKMEVISKKPQKQKSSAGFDWIG